MGAEKGSSKSGGFFHLFDWNRKSRKKLFSSGSPEGTKQGKRSDETLPVTRLRLIDEDEIAGVASLKGSSDYSYASSVTDEEGNGTRAPGVVARLMGLDSMPTSSVSEPYSTPFFDSRSLLDNHCQKRSPEFYVNDKFNHAPHRTEGYFRKPMEPRTLKMPSSPIERFQTEILPPRSAKSLPITHHKLLSPIKTPGFTSAKNAAQIMEAAARIIEPGLYTHSSMKSKVSSLVPSSIPLKVRDPKESMTGSQRASRLLQLSRAPSELTDVQFSRVPLNRSWNNAEDIVIFRSSPDPYEINASAPRAKGKSISLAVQAKVNVQRREGLVMPSKSTSIQKEHEECKLSQPFRSLPNNQKNKQQKKPSTGNASGVLRQNNQKQNCASSKGKSAMKQSMPNQPGRKVLSGDASSGKHKSSAHKLSGSSRVGCRKQVLENMGLEREGSSLINKDFPQKKRLIEGSFSTEKNAMTDRTVVNTHETHVQPSVVIDQHTKWNEDNKNSTDVVSFTFTSPLLKQFGSSQSSKLMEVNDKKNGISFDTLGEKNAYDLNRKGPSSIGFNILSGDALSHLLEQKLRELTSGIEPSRNFIKMGIFAPTVPVQEESKLASDNSSSVTVEQEEFPGRFFKNKSGSMLKSDTSSTDGQVLGMSHKLPVAEAFECRIEDACKGLNHQDTSPLSILEASFLNDSWQSSESTGSTDGSITCQSSVHAQKVMDLDSSRKVPSREVEIELSDSASSGFADIPGGPLTRYTSHTKAKNGDAKYVREILCNMRLSFENLSSYTLTCTYETFNPFLFDKFETKTIKNTQGKEDKDKRASKKVLFDCVQECLDLKCSRYFRAGYQAWAKGLALTRKDLAEEINEEISGWMRMGEWMVDELVDNDMSTHLGRWLDFNNEVFDTGIEIQGEILSSLIDEVLDDFRAKG